MFCQKSQYYGLFYTCVTPDTVLKVVEAVKRGEYCAVVGDKATEKLTDQLKIQLGYDSGTKVVAIPIPEKGITINEITAQISGSQVENTLGGPVSDFSTVCEELSTREGKTVLVLAGIQHIKPNIAGDLFRAIRGQFNVRATNPGMNNLTWVLVGSKHPDDLITDKTGTPYNIGTNFHV
ncbi:MAG: hypothetical protein G01um101416_799 [Microgenomates group bacterium Gr01-1014_16]|nr:MAG: hypothetical protein G01um101416_799 [Microgenomates group bacterium Gr01-1014_16]